MQRIYLAIDLKSYYASAECAARHLDPLTTNLVVADSSRTEKTICLAVSPSLKAYGISGRARLFEVMQKVKEVNANRLREAVRLRKAVYKDGKPSFSSASYDSLSLAADPSLEPSYLVAPPRMAYYEKVSRQIYGIYLKYIAPEDIVVYSIDEVFIDATSYLSHYNMTAHDLAMTIIREVLYTTGITATAGIGTNLYLAKLAMDITAKHAAPDKDGVRIAELDEESFRYLLWDYKPLTDFWMTGPGTVKRLEKHGIHTMGELAYFSTVNQDILYREFGVDAELLIDHAWGLEPCSIKEIKAYKPSTNSISEGQVLSCPYPYDKARIIIMEMADSLVLQLTDKGLVTDSLTLDVCIQSHLLCSLCRACCHLADCHLRLANLHHTYSTVDCYCSSHHVHHCFVLSPGLLGGKDTEGSGFEEHTWQIRGILMKRTDSAVKRRKKPGSKEG